MLSLERATALNAQMVEEASLLLSKPEVRIVADMKIGSEQATAWGCDLTYDYVRINGDYRS